MARETINGISVPIPGTGEPADFVGDLRQIATDLSASIEARLAINVIDYGADPTGATSSKTAIEAALTAAGSGGTIYFPPGSYHCANITISAPVKIASFKATLYKNANGPVLIFNAADIDCDVRIRGVGATYTGVGIEIQNAPDYRIRGRIEDTESYCVDHTTNDQSHRGAIVGPTLLQVRGAGLASVRMPPNESTVSGARSITNVFTGGAPLVDLAGGTMTYVIGCNFTTFVSSSLSKSAMFSANRIASATTVHGTNLVFVGNEIGGTLTLDTDCSQAVIGENRIAGSGVVDNGTDNTVRADRVTGSDMPAYTVDPRVLANTGTLNANQRIYQRITSPGRTRISKIGLHVSAASGNINVAVYSGGTNDGTAAAPMTKRADSGSVPCPAIGYAELTLDTTINVSDQDWISLVADNATAAFYRGGANGFSTGLGKGLCAFQSSAFAAPATATPSNSALFSFLLTGVQ